MCRLGYSIYLPTRRHRDCLPKFCIRYVWLKVILISGEAKPFLRYMHFDLIEAIGCVFGDRLLRHVHCQFYDDLTLRSVATIRNSRMTEAMLVHGPSEAFLPWHTRIGRGAIVTTSVDLDLSPDCETITFPGVGKSSSGNEPKYVGPWTNMPFPYGIILYLPGGSSW